MQESDTFYSKFKSQKDSKLTIFLVKPFQIKLSNFLLNPSFCPFFVHDIYNHENHFQKTC